MRATLVKELYFLCGQPVQVVCSDQAQAARLRGLWRDLFVVTPAAGEGGTPAVRLHFNSMGPGEHRPQTGERVFSSPSLVVTRTAGGFHIRCRSSAMSLDLAGGYGNASLDEDFWDYPLEDRREFFLLTLLMLLRRRGLFGLHANAVESEGAGLLTVGRSGCGKTTLTLALVLEGWRCLSDDALVLRRGPSGVTALAFRRGMSLTADTAGRFLAPEVWHGGARLREEKVLVHLDSVFPRSALARCRPRAIVFPRVVGARRSQLVPASETSAFVRLLEQSPGIMTDRASVKAQAEVLKLLLEQCRTYDLALGIDVFEDPGSLSSVLRQVLEAGLCGE